MFKYYESTSLHRDVVKLFSAGRQKCFLDLGGKRVYTIVGGKRVFAVGGKRVFLIWAGKECLSFRSAKESFVVWAAKECLLLWAAKEFLPQAEKEFSSYAAKVRVAKVREETELQPIGPAFARLGPPNPSLDIYFFNNFFCLLQKKSPIVVRFDWRLR